MEAAPHPLASPLGRISISSDVVASIVGNTAAECYGVVGMSAPSRVGRATRRLSRDRPTRGVVVRRENGGVAIELYVVVEYGLNLAEVAATVRSRVGYEIERLTGLSVSAVEVHIQDVRRSE
ncbi:MAG: hypothetical protein QOE36_999 [Gaiellaceae bacterium]|nr:hypothetical protein [Gaiellaceae bacterium]